MFKEAVMEKNVGKTDKLIRLGLGAILLIIGANWPCWLCVVLGVILIATGILQKCPVYKLMKKNTCKRG